MGEGTAGDLIHLWIGIFGNRSCKSNANTSMIFFKNDMLDCFCRLPLLDSCWLHVLGPERCVGPETRGGVCRPSFEAS